MKVPNHGNAQIPPGKITDYLLNLDHPDGSSKARFLLQLGFNENSLSVALLEHVRKNSIIETKTTPYGVKYIIEGSLRSPSGRKFILCSVWIILIDETNPKLVTAYPSKK